MIALHRNFGVPPRGPIYEPPSKFGNATICDVKLPSPKPNAMTPSERLWSIVPAIIFVVFVGLMASYTATSLWNVFHAAAAHTKTCELRHHVFTPCGE